MYRKMLFVLFILVSSSPFCRAQTLPPLSSAGFVTPPVSDLLGDRDWQIAALSFQLSSIRSGTPVETAVQELAALGGTVDGGLQTIPPTRFYFDDPGILVEILVKDGRVEKPLHWTLVGQRMSGGGFNSD